MTIGEVLEFFDNARVRWTLVGSGPGKSGTHRMTALRNMLEAAGAMITYGDNDGAIEQLEDIKNRCDGIHPPPDFVEGPERVNFYNLVQRLIDYLEAPPGCGCG